MGATGGGWRVSYLSLTRCCFCVCVDALNATVGNSFLRCLSHSSTFFVGTRSASKNVDKQVPNDCPLTQIATGRGEEARDERITIIKNAPILFKTKTNRFWFPQATTASSTFEEKTQRVIIVMSSSSATARAGRVAKKNNVRLLALTWGHRQPMGSRASRTSKTTSAALTTWNANKRTCFPFSYSNMLMEALA